MAGDLNDPRRQPFNINGYVHRANINLVYQYDLGCRCDRCYVANALQQQKYYDFWKNIEVPEHAHGTYMGCMKYLCECRECREMKSRIQANSRKRLKFKH